jgi:hypothetical protein
MTYSVTTAVLKNGSSMRLNACTASRSTQLVIQRAPETPDGIGIVGGGTSYKLSRTASCLPAHILSIRPKGFSCRSLALMATTPSETGGIRPQLLLPGRFLVGDVLRTP